jgi:small subunit ribosomal protein S30e
MGKLHGTLAKAGKVRKQTPKVEKQVRRHKIPKGRAYKRICFNRRYLMYVFRFGAAAAAAGP